jgi:hypothetical protein
LGDQTEQPAAATNRGAEPSKSSMSSPAVHGEDPAGRAAACPVAAVDAQADARDLRRDAAHGCACANRRIGCSSAPSSGCTARASSAGEASGRRLVARGRRQLGLDVEAHVLGFACRTRSNTSVKAGCARRPSRAARKPGGIGAAGLQASDIVALHLRQGERADRGSLGLENLPSGPVWSGIETAVVADDENPIAGRGESSSSVVTPIAGAVEKREACSGARPRAPR